MELVYPIYIDSEMMTAFLASLEGGIVEDLTIEEKEQSKTEGDKSASLDTKLAQSLSALFSVSGKAGIAKRYTESLDSIRKGSILFPEASLFIRLRSLLSEQGIIKRYNQVSNFSEMRIGDLIEFTAKFKPSPVNKLKKIIDIMPVWTELENKKKMVELDTQIGLLEKLKPNEQTNIDGQIVKFDSANLNLLRANLKAQRALISEGFNESSHLTGLVLRSIESGAADVLIGDTIDGSYICKAYKKYAREGNFSDVFNSQWHIIGKIIGFVSKDEEYNMLIGSLIDIMPQKNQDNMFNSVDKDKVNIDFSEARIKGPALIIATLAIFS